MAQTIGLSFALLFSMVCLTTAFFHENPCNVVVFPEAEPTQTRDVTVPEGCLNGTFSWDYPRRTVKLHFPNPDHREMAVCIRNGLLGNVFTVRDVTHTFGFPMVIGDKESCTFKYHEMITLRIDAPETLYYIASIVYRILSN